MNEPLDRRLARLRVETETIRAPAGFADRVLLRARGRGGLVVELARVRARTLVMLVAASVAAFSVVSIWTEASGDSGQEATYEAWEEML